MIRQSLAFVAAASLAVSPVLAQSSVSAPSNATAVDRVGPNEADSDFQGASLFPLIIFVAIIVGGVLLATGVIFDDDKDRPTSP